MKCHSCGMAARAGTLCQLYVASVPWHLFATRHLLEVFMVISGLLRVVESP